MEGEDRLSGLKMVIVGELIKAKTTPVETMADNILDIVRPFLRDGGMPYETSGEAMKESKAPEDAATFDEIAGIADVQRKGLTGSISPLYEKRIREIVQEVLDEKAEDERKAWCSSNGLLPPPTVDPKLFALWKDVNRVLRDAYTAAREKHVASQARAAQTLCDHLNRTGQAEGIKGALRVIQNAAAEKAGTPVRLLHYDASDLASLKAAVESAAAVLPQTCGDDLKAKWKAVFG